MCKVLIDRILRSTQSLEVFTFVAVKCNEDEQHDGEGPHRGTSVADERQRDTDYRHKADCHAYIDEQVHEDAAGDAVSVDSRETLSAAFGLIDYPPEQKDIQNNYSAGAEEAPFLSDCTEDEVRTLLWHESVCSLGSLQISFAKEAA